MAVYLTSGAILKMSTGKCTSDDLKPVLQLIFIKSSIEGKQKVVLSDGSFHQRCVIPCDIFISNKLQIGSIVQLTKFQSIKLQVNKGYHRFSKMCILCLDLTVIRCKSGLIGHPKLLPDNETPLVESASPTILDEGPPTSTQKQDHVDSLLNEEDIDVQEPSTFIQNPSTSTQKQNQKRSSHSPTQNKRRRRKLGTLGEHVSKMTGTMMEKYKEVEVGFKKLETLEENVSKIAKMMMDKHKEDDVGACFKKLETLEQDVSKMAKKMMDKNKEDDVGGCFKKLESLEQDVSKLTRMMMEKNKEDVVGFNKLEILEEDVSKMKKMTMEKNKEDDVGACFKKLETLEEDVSKLTRMMMEKNKEDDMGACIEKLDKMGWGAEDPIFDTALLLFLKGADYRKLWLHLKPECCEKWVKIAGSISGLLD